MPKNTVHRIENNTGIPLFWYERSRLLLHDERFFAVDPEYYLGELLLETVTTKQVKVILTYPPVPFSQERYLLNLQYVMTMRYRPPEALYVFHSQEGLPNPFTYPITGRSIAFFPMRHLPGDSGYIHPVFGQSRDFLTPSILIIQNFMRRVARAAITRRRLTMAMGLHSRLGEGSPIMELGTDLLWSILASC
jgi:hypothetical protein